MQMLPVMQVIFGQSLDKEELIKFRKSSTAGSGAEIFAGFLLNIARYLSCISRKKWSDIHENVLIYVYLWWTRKSPLNFWRHLNHLGGGLRSECSRLYSYRLHITDSCSSCRFIIGRLQIESVLCKSQQCNNSKSTLKHGMNQTNNSCGVLLFLLCRQAEKLSL